MRFSLNTKKGTSLFKYFLFNFFEKYLNKKYLSLLQSSNL